MKIVGIVRKQVVWRLEEEWRRRRHCCVL